MFSYKAYNSVLVYLVRKKAFKALALSIWVCCTLISFARQGHTDFLCCNLLVEVLNVVSWGVGLMISVLRRMKKLSLRVAAVD